MKSSHFYQVEISVILITLCTIQVQTTVYNEPIISGTEAALGQFPWHVVLKKNKAHDLLCGGSIISDSWVLTAAQCTIDRTCILLAFGTIIRDNYNISMTSKKIFRHPKYNFIGYKHDVALIKLPKPLTFNANIKPIPLVSSAEANNVFIGEPAIIMGFGRTSDKSPKFSEVLLWANVLIISNSVCAPVFIDNSVQNETMCAVGEKQPITATCKGDSGGALAWKNKAGKTVQIAITTFYSIYGCAKNYPTGFTRINWNIDFITNITGLAFDK